ncbi:hypothetical protein [Treponema pallidum]|uniref:Lipoprotein n=1 Tax=Treponema pallidum subsp. pertenue (strain Gauthier) TaxID=491080 RepID=A0AAU8PRG9_TREPG|nr:hypothetical protein [Treponema pallidum]AEZ57186.1 hypothetical protein TPESAMD_0069 [Treponema pallidum subsp. pertenue str. SamoaD]AEZ58254.1 hypothetical protein TPECDC2_0069 [Treponema pallidum subsp. pertenue str. CDC2]AEZ59322.1 hypothetical protein TPEGAU_0069 [Treponema pallidum subsp. pertenue str. Gauthier]AGK83710.1 hypothetical protein TPFB_0069 [Treponema pallidum str. Fribourg-Blanc]ASV57715.1 hypothetical protein TPEGhana051_0069 [Treponema pallidum subsp. pertenue]
MKVRGIPVLQRRTWALVLLVLSSTSACVRKNSLEDVRFPSNSPIGEARRFAVITKAYVLLRDKPGVTGIVIAYARRKDIFPVLGIDLLSKDKESALWVNVERGWLPWDCVQLYSSKAKALAASKKLS